MARIPKGDSVLLNVTQQARHRVVVGLGWDPNETIGLKDKALGALGLKDTHHDLDLSCYLYDVNKRYISRVSHEVGFEVDQTGQIYHSGDNVEGVGDGDDEQISVELKDLDQTIHFIVFKASIKTENTFKDVTDPEIRLADGYSDHNFLHLSLLDSPENDRSAFAFVCLFKNAEQQWMVKHIGEFFDPPADGEWSEKLKSYL